MIGDEQDFAAGAGKAVQFGLKICESTNWRASGNPPSRYKRGEQGFDGVGQQGGLAAASGLLLATAESQVAAQLQFVGAFQKVIGIDEMGAQFGSSPSW